MWTSLVYCVPSVYGLYAHQVCDYHMVLCGVPLFKTDDRLTRFRCSNVKNALRLSGRFVERGGRALFASRQHRRMRSSLCLKPYKHEQQQSFGSRTRSNTML